MTLQNHKAATGMDVPQSDRLVFTAAANDIAVWTKSDGPDPAGMTVQRFETGTSTDVPETYSLVVAPAGEYALF
jgi:hypothetical protein